MIKEGKIKKIISCVALCSMVYFQAQGQMPEEDQKQFDEAMSWIETNLEYVYQNPSTGQWWHNKFFYNPKNGEINIKNSSSDVPNATDKEVYFDRVVSLRELDLTSVHIEEVKENKGRVVKGKVLHIDAIGKAQRIQKLYNGKPSFKEFFLQIPIPKSNADFIAQAEDCKRHFETVIRLSAEVYPKTDSLQNTDAIFDLMPGKYNGTDQSTCEIEVLFPYTMELRFFRKDQLYKKSVITYDKTNHHFVYWMVNVAGSSHFDLNLSYESQITLEANTQSYTLAMPNSNYFSIRDEGTTISYHRADF
ncbi:hypothetical protein N7E81_12070 [Reichenbachiella carrageenanivorans]|uniref:Uncharacterized protein n=1 Tax=Reichenbachiella carrageenanivorans TaxID=2979869 RepID=A0ABY6CXL0_9BACT|nr:hypothetical protein [Reichenbachiella carrageenanivorans]UXX78094.1 hypothetical protein N7E81_12070 [Reichenbachiella carrageenanivorans]